MYINYMREKGHTRIFSLFKSLKMIFLEWRYAIPHATSRQILTLLAHDMVARVSRMYLPKSPLDKYSRTIWMPWDGSRSTKPYCEQKQDHAYQWRPRYLGDGNSFVVRRWEVVCILQHSYFSFDEDLFHWVLKATRRTDLFHSNVNTKEIGLVHGSKGTYVLVSQPSECVPFPISSRIFRCCLLIFQDPSMSGRPSICCPFILTRDRPNLALVCRK